MSKRALVPLATASALLGGVVAAAGVALLDLGEHTTTRTIVQQAPLAAQADGRIATGGAMTARDRYNRD
jgi:hypothetical protein